MWSIRALERKAEKRGKAASGFSPPGGKRRTGNKRVLRVLPWTCLLVLLSLALPSWAGVPALNQASLFFNTMAYDRNIMKRAGGSIMIAVIYNSGSSSSTSCKRAMVKAFKKISRRRLRGLAVSVTQMDFSSSGALESAIDSKGIDALYLCSGLSGDIGEIKSVSRRNKVMTMTDQISYVNSGVAIGVKMVRGKAKLYVNLSAAKAEGVALRGDLLRSAVIVR